VVGDVVIALSVPHPYDFVRAVTIVLATLWTISGVQRALLFTDRWQEHLGPLGFSNAWLRRQVLRVALRATVLDPLNLALMLALVLSWTVRGDAT
jgi:hypothetical protein